MSDQGDDLNTTSNVLLTTNINLNETSDIFVTENVVETSEETEVDINQSTLDLWSRFMEVSSVLANTTSHNTNILTCFEEFIKSVINPSLYPVGCPVKFDGVSCWPATSTGTMRSIPCFEEFNGLVYDSSENATLFCEEDGGWADRASYGLCMKAHIPQNVDSRALSVSGIRMIFFIGNSISFVAVVLALSVFVSLKELRCLRNTIHINLLATYLLHNLFWVMSAAVQNYVPILASCSFFVILNYFIITNFMWMFVEGLFLYMLVVETFLVDNIKLRVYIAIGWGVPVPVIVAWLLVKTLVGVKKADSDIRDGSMEPLELSGCPLLLEGIVDWINRVPVLFALSANILFLVRIMWVLITKLRSTNNVETQRYRKATKALLVLIPLLGLTYMLLIALPQELEHVRALLLSTQGLWVAIFYCFLNSEVRNSIKHQLDRWKLSRDIAESRGRESFRNRGSFSRESRRKSCREEISMSTDVTTGEFSSISISNHNSCNEGNVINQDLPGIYSVENNANDHQGPSHENTNNSQVNPMPVPRRSVGSFMSTSNSTALLCNHQNSRSLSSLNCFKKSKNLQSSCACSTTNIPQNKKNTQTNNIHIPGVEPVLESQVNIPSNQMLQSEE